MPAEPNPLSAARQLELLRDSKQSAPIHPLERRLLVVLCVHLCLMPWLFGTMHSWSQIPSLVLSAVGFALALAPRDIEMAGRGGTVRANLRRRLLGFPIFWLGLALLLYLVVQAGNPAWSYQRNPIFWWLHGEPNAAWLPTSVRAPFHEFNIWRQFIIYADAWLLVCSVWVGLTRRASLRILLGVIVANAMALGVVLIWERLTGAIQLPPSMVDTPGIDLTSAFIYKNHAGAYFTLVVFSAVALGAWFFDHGKRRLLKSTPASVCALAGIFLMGTIFFTLSRGAVLSFGAALLVFIAWFAVRRMCQPTAPDSNRALTATLAAVFVLFGLVAIHYLDFSRISGGLDSLATQEGHEPSVSSRVLARSAAEDLIKDHGLRGVGAGCFRYVFPEYVKNYPEIYQGGRQYWEHAHCDWLEIPTELGLAGSLLVFAGAGWWGVWFARHRVLWHPLAVPLLLGCLATVIHAGFDFPFQCPAILATWCVLIAVAGRWVELESAP